MRTMKDMRTITHPGVKLFLVMSAVALLCLVSPGRLFSNPAREAQSASLHSSPLKRTMRNANQATPWKNLLKPLPDCARPERLSYAIGGFNVWKYGAYRIRLTDAAGSTLYYDPIQHYYLETEEDNPRSPAEYRVLLLDTQADWNTPPNGDVDDAAPVTSRIQRRHLSLVTDTGVRIGDSIYTVARKLGSPSYVGIRELDYTYQGGGLHGWSYDSHYWFDYNRLDAITIVLARGSGVAG